MSPSPTPEEIAAWECCPPLKPWEDAFALLDGAMREHPALKGKSQDLWPTLWCGADHCMLRAPDKTGVHVRIDSGRWYQRVSNERQARIFMDVMVNELREKMREARRARQ